jgi:thymidine kinase
MNSDENKRYIDIMQIVDPEFMIFTGPMFSGKTSRMIMEIERFKYQHKNIEVFKPHIDIRYSDEDIVTHGGAKLHATCIKHASDILERLQSLPDDHPVHVVAVDEAFMINGIADVLLFLFKNGVTIIVSSLEISSSGKSFKEMEKMLPWATMVKKCSAICLVCGKNAFYTHRKIEHDNEVCIGGSEIYEPRCFTHYPLINKRDI